jgi:hypothetical protein
MTAKKTYSLYLSTNGQFAPQNKTNLGNLTWSANWDTIFGNEKSEEVNVRVSLVSKSSAAILTWANNVGSVRCSFISPYQSSNNGCNVASIQPVIDLTTNTANSSYLSADTTKTKGITILKPKGTQDFNIQILDRTESIMANVTDYQIFLYFDIL